ncbi:hypothetical protein Gotri_027916 [Gossypium trilobum]|uniref:FHA domain-containing protein n=1 Tax=Gossypium trilobum TaxID=34281 RepID=A0A7J9FP23_9ROSI|nr:hypothetical protein [Gossypium trilobum]
MRVAIIRGMARMAAMMALTYKAYLGVGLGPLSSIASYIYFLSVLQLFLLLVGNDILASQLIYLCGDENKTYMIGSEKSENFPESSVVVPSKEVSKMHAQISYKDGAFFIVDLLIEYVMNHGGRRSRVPPNFPTGLRPSDVIEFGSDKKATLKVKRSHPKLAEKEWAGILQNIARVSMESHVPINQNETWTEETHVHLNSIEAWFVRTMLQSNDCYNLRLNRHLPDSFDSTLDCKPRTKHSTAGPLSLGIPDGPKSSRVEHYAILDGPDSSRIW